MLVAEHRRLGNTGGAAREQQHGNVVGVHAPVAVLGSRFVTARRVGEEVGLGDGRDGVDRGQMFEVGLVGDRQSRADPLGQREQIVGRQAVVEGHVGHPRPRCTEQFDGHRMARLVAEHGGVDVGVAQPPSRCVGVVEQLLVGDAAARARTDGGSVTETGRRHLEQHHQVHGGGMPQSEAGRVLAWAIASASPPAASEPSPALVASSSMSPASLP